MNLNVMNQFAMRYQNIILHSHITTIQIAKDLFPIIKLKPL